MHYANVWNKVLNPSEEVKFEFSVGNKYRKFGLILSLVLFGIIFLSGLISQSGFITSIGLIFIALSFFRFWYKKVSNAYAFTDKRVLIHHGWLSTKAQSVDYSKITEVSISEPFLSRIITKSGDMSIHTGNITDALVLQNIEAPYEIKKKLDALRHA